MTLTMDSTLAKLATKNLPLLSEMTADEVLLLHPVVPTTDLQWKIVKKTKPIKARPINTILDKSDPSIFEQLLLKTLEGSQGLRRNSFICVGEAGDCWQQTKDKLHDKYIPAEVDEDGWTEFRPKATNKAHGVQITEDFQIGPYDGFSVVNPWWGDRRIVEGEDRHYQFGVKGDWILQNPSDPQDTYIVAEKFFENTYVVQ